MRIGLIHIIIFIIPQILFGEGGRVPAFPGAEGAGKYSTGGRDGRLVFVTNLDDSGKGSLRYAIDQKGPRIIIFKVSGTIELKKEIIIEHGDLTIAGESSPGEGICIKAYPVLIEADNVIMRYIRIRLGDISGEPFDAINCKRTRNVIIDHCSFSWAVDECASFYDNESFTLQWSIISESLNESVHPKGHHGYGGIWGGMQASFHHNLLAHHTSRLPRFQGSRYHEQAEKEKAEFCNNVIYNWRDQCMYGGEEGNYNIEGNVFIPGPATDEDNADEILRPYEPYGRFYLRNNVISNNSDDNNSFHSFKPESEDLKRTLISNPVSIEPAVRVSKPENAYINVLKDAGASLERDDIDKRIVEEVRKQTFHHGNKGIIDSQEQVGGWPELKISTPPEDMDMDGMADRWEEENDLDPSDNSDFKTYDLSPDYMNIEIYLHDLITQKANK